MQNLIDVCNKKLDSDPNHIKALILRSSSYIKRKELDLVLTI